MCGPPPPYHLRIFQNPPTPRVIPFHPRAPDKQVCVGACGVVVTSLYPPHEEDDGEKEGDPDENHAVGAPAGGVGGEVVAGHVSLTGGGGGGGGSDVAGCDGRL